MFLVPFDPFFMNLGTLWKFLTPLLGIFPKFYHIRVLKASLNKITPFCIHKLYPVFLRPFWPPFYEFGNIVKSLLTWEVWDRNKRPEWNGHSILTGMKWAFHSGRNGMPFTPFWPEWNAHSIQTGMKWSFHSGRNGMPFTPFRPEWNAHSIQTGMKCSFHSGRNGMPSTPFRPEWNDPFHSGRNGMVNPLHRHKKYAPRTHMG